MDVREFLISLISEEKSSSPQNEFTGNLDRVQAIHLLRRFGLGPKPSEIDIITGKSANEAADIVLGTGNEPLPADPTAAWATTPEENPLEQITDIRFEIEGRLRARFAQFQDWWLQRLRDDSLPSVEKLVQFWHTIWCIEFTYDTQALIPPPLLYKNNKTIRKNRLIDYKKFAEDMTLDGAMILYQSLYYSHKSKPNENYMRELMELFTMGIGNYSEADIREGSRALTGWRTAAYYGEPHPFGYFETYFVPDAHDIGAKTFMKETISARTEQDNTLDQVLEQEVRGLLNIMFNKRANEISKFIANKVFRFFIYSSPGYDEVAYINELADEFKNSNFSIRRLLYKMITSEMFYDEKFKGVQIKTPIEYIIGLEKLLNVNYKSRRTALSNIEQELYDPPNVGSWKAYRTWVNTKTYPLRVKYANEIIDLVKEKEAFDLIYSIPEYQNLTNFIEGLEQLVFPVKLPNEVTAMNLQSFKTYSKLDESTWSQSVSAKSPQIVVALVSLLKDFVNIPDFQLC